MMSNSQDINQLDGWMNIELIQLGNVTSPKVGFSGDPAGES